MTMQQRARRKTSRVIEIDANGRRKPHWRQWLTKTFKIVVAATGLVTFVRNFGWRILVGVIAFAGTAGAMVLDI